MADLVISEEMRTVIRNSKIEGNTLTLPGTLDRKLYLQVNVLIEKAKGRWSRKDKCHVFASDPRAIFGIAEQTKVIDEKKARQAFYTPGDLATGIVGMADVEGRTVLEPSAGGGALAQACIVEGAAAVLCVEMDPEEGAALQARGFPCLIQDFLTLTPEKAGKWDRVIMNPPFSKNQDIAHVRHAVKFLRHDGILTAIMGANTSRVQFLRMVEEMERTMHVEIEELPADSFKESGTGVNTILLTARFKETK